MPYEAKNKVWQHFSVSHLRVPEREKDEKK